jgi:hypothetical protein
MNKNTFEGSTNPMERNDQDRSDPVVHPNPNVLATLIQETPMGEGAVTVDPADDLVFQDVALNQEPPSLIPPVDVTGKNVESVVALLGHDESEHFRTRWNEVQGKFVDEPRSAVQQADALVSDVIEKITQMFASEHGALEEQWKEGKDVSTEDLRQALRHYRSFFKRLVV